jgi:hypothetical protein
MICRCLAGTAAIDLLTARIYAIKRIAFRGCGLTIPLLDGLTLHGSITWVYLTIDRRRLTISRWCLTIGCWGLTIESGIVRPVACLRCVTTEVVIPW